MAKQTSRGKCYFCDNVFSKSGMSRHLKACEERKIDQKEASGEPRKLYHLQIEGRYYPIYWLHVEMPAGATLAALDRYLRNIWLECCGHLSQFTIGEIYYDTHPEMARDWGQDAEGMNVELGKVLRAGMKFEHVYDFGSSTYLTLKVVDVHEAKFPVGESIREMARNDPPPIPCGVCGEPAAIVCTYCSYEVEGWLCKKCANKHPCGDEAFLPIVNSPRTGVCGYTGA